MSALHCVPPFARRTSVLSTVEHASMLHWVLANEGLLSPSRVTGDVHRSQGRRARSYYGDPPWAPWMAERISALLPGILPEIGIAPFAPSGFEIELVAYGDQCFIGRHRDTGTGVARHRHDRIVSIVYYLHAEPRGFTGGELRLWSTAPGPSDERAHVDVPPDQNTLVAFPSWAIHEVLPVQLPSGRYADARFAINFWARRAHD